MTQVLNCINPTRVQLNFSKSNGHTTDTVFCQQMLDVEPGFYP